MAVPTAPTLVSLTTEGLKKAGHFSPSASELTRAQDQFMEEIKNDVFTSAKKIKSLQTTSILVLTQGLSRYALPTDYSSDMVMNRLYGSHVGTSQAGTVNSITLAADEDIAESTIIGKSILIYSGTGLGSMSQCVTYDETTKVAGVSPDFDTAPNGTSKYMVIDTSTPMSQEPIWNVDSIDVPTKQGEPSVYAPIGDVDNGEIIIYPVPYRADAVPYSLQLRYYANLMKLDLSSTLMSTLYQRWRNLWVKGVELKQLQADDDDRAERVRGEYLTELQGVIAREQYGMDLTNLQARVLDY